MANLRCFGYPRVWTSGSGLFGFHFFSNFRVRVYRVSASKFGFSGFRVPDPALLISNCQSNFIIKYLRNSTWFNWFMFFIQVSIFILVRKNWDLNCVSHWHRLAGVLILILSLSRKQNRKQISFSFSWILSIYFQNLIWNIIPESRRPPK